MDGFNTFRAPALARLDATSDIADQLALLRGDGVLILENALSEQSVASVGAEFDQCFAETAPGEGAFFGRNTKRFSAAFAKAPSTIELALHPQILELIERVLIGEDIGPRRADRIQLNLTQAVSIGPGEPEQVVHRDQQMYGITPGFELLANVMFCIDDFTSENGGTNFVPGSCAWQGERWPQPDEIAPAQAKAGSAIVWLGSMMHGGGANRTQRARRGLILSYNLGWLAQAEKLLLSIPPPIARDLPRRLQELIGYQVHRPNLGWIESRDPIEWLHNRGVVTGGAQDHLHGDHLALVDFYYHERARRLGQTGAQ